MGMQMLLAPRMICFNDGATSSIFKKSERYLFATSKHQKGLANFPDADKYKSVMDLLFCIVFPEYKVSCFQFYLDRKNPLRSMLSKNQIRKYDKILFTNLKSMKKQDWEIISDIAA